MPENRQRSCYQDSPSIKSKDIADVNTVNQSAQVLQIVDQADESAQFVISFDEMLFLQDPTEAYLKTLKPGFIAIFFLNLLDYIKPWRLFGADRRADARDKIRVLLMTALLPWSYWLWHRHAKTLAQKYENVELSTAVTAQPKRSIIIISDSLDFIVRPILRQMAVPWQQLIACRIRSEFFDYRNAKKERLGKALKTDNLHSNLLITNSQNDCSLIETLQSSYVVNWHIPAQVSSLPSGYFPFIYMEHVKKRNQNFFVHEIFIEGLIFFSLLLAWTQPHPLIHTAGLACLWLSFWCIYEIGYMENDVVAANYEHNPTLVDDYDNHQNRIDFYRPWLWSFALAIPGLLLLQLSDQFESPFLTWLGSREQLIQLATQLGLWSLLLLTTRIIYSIYNYIDEQSRVWLYPVLQALKFVGLFMYTAASPLAWIYLLSLINSRWVPYIIYRYGNLRSFPKSFPMLLMHFVSMVIAMVPTFLSCSNNFDPLQVSLVMLIVGFRAKKEVIALINQASLITDGEEHNSFRMKHFFDQLFPKL